MAESLNVRIRRTAQGEDSRWDTFQLSREEKMSVLDVVTRIQREQDPTLAYRYSCRAGMCGSCAMRVNGKNRWTCRTQVADLGAGTLTLEPLPHYPVLRDLAVDMVTFFERYRAIRPEFVPADPDWKHSDFARIRPSDKERQEIDAHVECITCGSCVGECSFVATNKGYLGPAALNRAHVLLSDSRDGAYAERLEKIGGHDGVWGCHTQFNCTAVCPVGLSPTRAIQNLKRRKVRNAIKTTFTSPFRTQPG